MSLSYYFSSGSTTRREEQQQTQKQQLQFSSRYNSKQRREQQQPQQPQQQVSYNNRYSSIRNDSTTTTRTPTLPAPRHSTTLLQQQQITDLQKKIDLILMHNQKLQSEKQRYRHLYQQLKLAYDQLKAQTNSDKLHYQSQLQIQKKQQQQLQQQQLSSSTAITTARFVNEESNIMVEKLRKQLQLATSSYEKKLQASYDSRTQLKQQLSTLSKIIQDVNSQNKQLKLSLKEQSLNIDSLTFELKEQFIRSQVELENKLRDQFLIREIEYKNEKKMVVEACEGEVKEMREVFEKQKLQIESKYEEDIKRLKLQFEQQKANLIQQLKQQNEKQLQIIQNKHRQQIKCEQDKAIEYINSNIENVKEQDEMIKLEYEEEINRLRESLESRKELIEQLLEGVGVSKSQSQRENVEGSQQQERQQGNGVNVNPNNEHDNSLSNPTILSPTQLTWLPELLTMKHHLQHITTQYLQQSQLLKLKLTQKFHTDITSLKKIYQNKIQLITLHNSQLQQQNHRLRKCYEQSLQKNIKTKKQHQLEKIQLKNIIRKLNIQVQGIQEEYKLNIEGVRSMNNTFSMTVMKSMLQVKEKANFYSEENRKLRQAYEDHEKQLAETERLCGQKIAYYQQKVIVEKQKSAKLIMQLKQKLQLTQQQAQERQSHLRDSLDKQHEMIHEVVSEMRKQVETLSKQNEKLVREVGQMEGKIKDKDYEVDRLRSVIGELEADVERLKLQLSMGGGVGEKNFEDTMNQWKYHYQTTIEQLQQQIQILQSKLDTKQQQLLEIVKKYQLLEHDLNKIVKTLNKKSQLQSKVLEIGLDNNLVSNLGILFGNMNNEEGEDKENTVVA